MRRFLLPIVVLTLSSCLVQKAGGKLNEKEGYIYYDLPAPQMRMQLYGDYAFHSIRPKHFPAVDKKFLKYATAGFNRTNPKWMYAAHTFVQPFYSTLGVLYKEQQVNDALLQNIKQQLQEGLKTTFNGIDSFYTSVGTAHYFTYPVRHPATGATTMHREYLINSQQHLIRFHFWTSESDTAILFRESELILKNIR